MKKQASDSNDSLFNGLEIIAHKIERLGNNDCDSNLGAIEGLSLEIKEGSERIAAALNSMAEAIQDLSNCFLASKAIDDKQTPG